MNNMIIGEREFNTDCYETGLNNNVMVVGAAGAGKTRSVVIPNILQMLGSYVISDPKGNLYDEYKPYLEKHGYKVKKVDFTNPSKSIHYNPLAYVRESKDITKIAHSIIYSGGGSMKDEPFWDNASTLYVSAMLGLMKECADYHMYTRVGGKRVADMSLPMLSHLARHTNVNESAPDRETAMDTIMENHVSYLHDSYAWMQYKKFRIAAGKTLKSILITVNSDLSVVDEPDIAELLRYDEVDIPSIGMEKTAVFVVVSDTDRSLDMLSNMFFNQVISELCRCADERADYKLPVPVYMILDDFATNVKIENFPRMISSFRSRNISAMIMLQAESQLRMLYGSDGQTVTSNCDTYLYLGTNNFDTAKAVAERVDVPTKRILNMPVGTNWILRRGSEPYFGRNFDLVNFMKEKEAKNIKNSVAARNTHGMEVA